MNGILNSFLFAGDEFRQEMHLRLDLPTLLVDHLIKMEKENGTLKKQEIQDIFIKIELNKTFSADSMKKTRFYGNVPDFSVDNDSIAVDNILYIHKYLMKKYNIK